MAGYADDVAFFISSDGKDQLTKDILQIYGEASGLRTDLQKSCVISIRCGVEIVEAVKKHFAMY